MRPNAEIPDDLRSLLISQQEIVDLISIVGIDLLMDEAILAVESALLRHAVHGGQLTARAGYTYHVPSLGAVEWMPYHDPGNAVTLKSVGYHPANSARGLPTVIATVQMFSPETGQLVALSDGVFLTAMRTGAASAVATRILSPESSSTLGLIGAGAQSVTQAHAISRVRPIDRVLIYDIDRDTARSAVQRLAFLGVDVRVVDRDELERRSHIICTATTVAPGEGPVMAGNDLLPGVHVNAVGSDLPDKVELPIDLLRKSIVCPDFLEQARVEGECQQLAPPEIGPALPAIVADPAAFHGLREVPTVFDSTGLALEDHAMLTCLISLATKYGLGTWTQLIHLPRDPYNPYDLGLGANPGPA